MSDSIPPVPDGSIPPAPFEPVSEAVPPAPPEPPMTPEIVDANPPKKSNRTIWIIVIVIVVLLLCCCCLGGGGLLAFPSIFGRNLLGWIDLNAYLPLLAGLA